RVHKQIRPFSAPVHAGARRSISVLVGCGILTLPDEKNSLAKPTALHRGGEIEQMKKCFLDTTAKPLPPERRETKSRYGFCLSRCSCSTFCGRLSLSSGLKK